MSKQCLFCGDILTTKRKKQKYCNRNCYKESCRKFDFVPYPMMWYKGKRELYHRVVYMESTGEILTSNDIVHHINNNPFDRRIENLEKLNGQAAHLHVHNYHRDKRKRKIDVDTDEFGW